MIREFLSCVLAISALAAMPAFAQPQQDGAPPTLAQVQKVIQIISGNKTKLQQYCDIATKLDPQIVEAVQKHDPNTLEALVKQADGLAQKIGPEYVTMMDGLPSQPGGFVREMLMEG